MTTSSPAIKPCNWCGGSGRFHDLDSDLSYGIPVCGRCGGIGSQYEGPDFNQRRNQILQLRFAYCPTSEQELGPGGDLPSCIRRSRLIELKEAITAIHEMYGAKNPEDRSFAKRVKEGLLDSAIAEYTNEIETFVLEPKDLVRLSPELAPRIVTSTLMHEGRLDEAEQRLTTYLASKPSNPAAFHHDLGTLFLEYRRNPEAALPHLLKASELAPYDVDSAYRAAHLLAFFKRIGEARTHALRARASTNFSLLDESSQTFVNNLITTTNHLC